MPVRFACVLSLVLAGCWSSSVDEVEADPDQHEKLKQPKVNKTDWPAWRGRHGDGSAPGPLPPTDISPTRNVVWKAPIPGRGYGSPIICNGRVYLTTADDDKEVQSLLCLNAETGKEVWTSEVHSGGFPGRGLHREASNANSTPACDGDRVLLGSYNDGKVYVTAFDAKSGKRIWQKQTGVFELDYGYTLCPCLWESYVIIAADSEDGSHMVALHRKTGEILWRKARPYERSYASPIVTRVGGREQLLICGCYRVDAYDPATGDNLWSVKSECEAMVGTPTWLKGKDSDGSDDLIFAAGGYPGGDVFGIRASDGKSLWKENVSVYVPSLIATDGHVYGITNKGVAYCWRAEDGKEMWKGRLGGSVRASPILCEGHLFALSMRGTLSIYKADPSEFNRVRKIEVGDEGFATPVIADGRLFVRTANGNGSSRQEWLYCFGKK